MAREKKIQPGEKVSVSFIVAECELLERTMMDPDYWRRLMPVSAADAPRGAFTLDELEDMLGFIAAEANHSDNSDFQHQLDLLFQRLQVEMESYDDGSWQTSF